MIDNANNLKLAVAAILCAALFTVPQRADAAEKAESVEELRNTVINLLEGLVQKGVISREQAQAMVQDAQDKAAATAKAKADQEIAEKDAVRVTYVPEIVRKQISDEVREELRTEVTKEVVAQAKKDKWGVPGALPAWVSNIKFSGDLRVRGQGDIYASDNISGTYADYQTINNRGGIARAGLAATLNTTDDRVRERLRLRVGLDAKITDGISAGVRLTTGSLVDPVSTNQTLGQSGARYQLAVDQAYLRFDAGTAINPKFPWMTVVAGRVPNPWFSSDLVWDSDLQFDGIAATWRWGFGGRPSNPHNVFFTAGAFPLQEVELSTDDKWLYGAQLGTDWRWSNEGRARIGIAYYYFDNITGIRNVDLGSTVFDYTAPLWMQKGNTLFNIHNDNGATDLFALAAKYQLANVTAGVEWPVFGHKVIVAGDYVKNIGYDEAEVLAHLPLTNDGKERVEGYQVELGFGSLHARLRGDWRANVGYRYVQRDAVVDGFTDSDFHLGGTDAKGYVLKGEWWFRDRISASLRYLSANEIDGPALGIDVLQLDVLGQF